MLFWSGIVLMLALSLDGFGVGFAYGLRNIRIPFSSLLTVASCSMLAMGLSMFAGHGFDSLIQGFDTSAFGAVILTVVGIWQVAQGLRQKQETEEEEAVPAISYNTSLQQDLLFKIYLKPMGLVIQVLRTPAVADMDGSGAINFREALVLGFALALDSFGAGFGAALTGFSLALIPGVALGQLLLVSLGRKIGKQLIPKQIGQRFTLVPGVVLILMGIFKLFT
ncbi:MAG TPA: sporulation membrane protein YtaF [Verrucomicrobiae bacterium]|nr:sporulation membrane protein YtaF [Verrucomicrobiae bacterium]